MKGLRKIMSSTIEVELNNIIFNEFTKESIQVFNNMKHDEDPISLLMRLDNDKGIDIYVPFKRFKAFENRLHCLIDGSYAMILNYPETINNPYSLDYRLIVCLDANIVSYLERYKYRVFKFKKKLTPEERLTKDVLRSMKRKDIQFDFLPYVLENTLKGNYNRDKIISTIGKFNYHNEHKLFKRLSSYLIEAENTFDLYEKLALNKMEYHQYFFKSFKAVLLAIAYIDKSMKTIKMKKQAMINFFDKELNKFLIPELRMANDYFKDNQSVKFLGKLNSVTNLMINIDNLSWDVFHLRALESLFRFDREPNNNIIPYFLSNDIKLINVGKYFKVAGIGYSKLGRDIYPIVDLKDDDLEFAEYFKDDEANKRFERSKNTNLDLIINHYTELLKKLIS